MHIVFDTHLLFLPAYKWNDYFQFYIFLFILMCYWIIKMWKGCYRAYSALVELSMLDCSTI